MLFTSAVSAELVEGMNGAKDRHGEPQGQDERERGSITHATGGRTKILLTTYSF